MFQGTGQAGVGFGIGGPRFRPPTFKKGPNREVLMLRKRLSLHFPDSRLRLDSLRSTDRITQKLFKHSFTKKIKQISMLPREFFYYSCQLRQNIRKLTFTRPLVIERKNFTESENKVAAKTFKSLKNLKKLVIPNLLPWKFLRATRFLHHLEILSIKIKETDVPHLYKIFIEASKLHTVELAIKKDGHPALSRLADLLWKLLKGLSSLKNLKSLQLIIEDCSFTQDPGFLYRLFGILGESNVETLFLKLSINGIEGEANEAAQKALSQIKTFLISSNCLKIFSSNFESMTAKQKKVVLDIPPQFSELQGVDISNLLSKCSGLNSLNLKDETGKFVVSTDSKFALDLRNLHLNILHKNDQKVSNLIGYFANSFNNSGVINFLLELYHFTDDILREVTKLNASFSPDKIQDYSISTVEEQAFLEALEQMQEMDRSDFQSGFEKDDLSRKTYFSKLPTSDVFQNFTQSLSRLTSLQKLSFFTRIEDTNYLKSVGDSFQGLVNLKECELLFHQGSKHADDYVSLDLPLEKLSSLERVLITLPSNFIFSDFLGLLDRMSQLQDFLFFTLKSESLDVKDKELMKKIAMIIEKFPKCKGLRIDQEDEYSGFQSEFILPANSP